jgi:hypothetical protein
MYIKNNLILHFDISNINSYNRNDLYIKSLINNPYQITNNITLNDYGLTQYDVGKVNSLIESKSFTTNDKYLILEQILEPDENGNLTDNNYGLYALTGQTIGYFLYSNGGYLNNPFKYHNYNIEYLPRQYKNGFTFETTLFIDENTFENIDNNSNIFLYLGMRAEDKFAESYSGNTTYVTTENSTLNNSYEIYNITKLKENTQYIDNITTILTTENIYIQNNNQSIFYIDYLNTENFKLILNNVNLTKDINYTFDLRNKIITLTNITVNITDKLTVNYYKVINDITIDNINISNIDNKKLNKNYNIDNNVLAFKFNENGNIGYRKISDNYTIEEDYSDNNAAYNGWNHIVITFKPDENNIETNIDDECDIISRNGTLLIFVNGLLCYKNVNFIEPNLRALPIDKSKQIGVPYNLSWGGGSFGLKHSYNFNNYINYPYSKNLQNDGLIIEQNFDGYFKGGFQKLRIYDKTLTISEILNNYRFESDYYGIQYNKGGRIIYVK